MKRRLVVLDNYKKNTCLVPSFQKRQFYFHNLTIWTIEKYATRIDVKPPCPVNTRARPCQYFPALKINLVKDLARPYLHVQGKDLVSNTTTMEQVVSICTLFNNPGMDIFINMALEMLKDSIDFKMACPFKKVKFNPSPIESPA